jgi:Ricin-type beta-trefoil lectin domain
MQKTRRTAAAATLSAVLVAGAVAGFMLTGGTAKASTEAGSCTLGSSAAATAAVTTCSIPAQTAGSTTPTTVTLTSPANAWIEVSATSSTDDGPVDLTWAISCTNTSETEASPAGSASATAGTSVTYVDFPDGMTDPESCAATVTATDAKVAAGDQITVALEYNVNTTATATATTASPTPTATKSTSAPVTVHQVHGYYGTCVDDFGNSSAERTKIGIWSCSPTDTAQSWSYSGDELKIHGMCVNAKGNGKSGSKLILWKCTGSANEIFVHNSKQEYVEKTNGWKYCIDDPGYSKKNGTQLFVYACNNGSNQHFSLP